MEITKSGDCARLLDAMPSVREIIEGAKYIGCAIVQSDGAWTRQGPTWWSAQERLFVTLGVGVANWGTTRGIAELASGHDAKARPTYHAVGLSVVPVETGNLVLVVPREVLEANPHFKLVLDLLDVVEGDLRLTSRNGGGASGADEAKSPAKPPKKRSGRGAR